jgi:hypothetical protein
MYARDEQYPLHVAEADGLGDPFPCRRLAEKCVQIGPFTGGLRLRATLDGVTWPVIHEEVGAPAGDGAVVAVPLAVKAIRTEAVAIVGDAPAVTLGGLLIG